MERKRRSKYLSESARKRGRIASERQRAAARIYIKDQITRWRELRPVTMETDEEFAKLLLDR